MSENPINPLRRLAGGLLIAIGVLWMLLCGACTAFFLLQAFHGGSTSIRVNEIAGVLAITLIPGGIGVGIGFGVYALGRAIAGARRKA